MTKITIIGSEKSGRTTLAAKLGEKGTVADITMYEFAKSGHVLTTIDATGYPTSIKPLLTALNLSDIALVCIPPEGPDAYTGECLVALDLLGYKHGIFVLTKSDATYPYALDELQNTIKKITADTCMQNWEYIAVSTTSFEGMDELKEMVFDLSEIVDEELQQNNDQPARVMVDQSFNVTGIGCVVLGVVTQGTIHAKDKMNAYPANKPAEIRSIQMHDVDVKSAPTGSRVGLALKNIQSKNIDRGFVLSNEEIVSMSLTLNCTLSPFSKGIARDDVTHIFVGLQSAPMRVETITVDGDKVERTGPGSQCILYLTGSKEIAYNTQDRFILTNLDENQRFMASGFIEI